METHAEIVDRLMLNTGLSDRALAERALEATSEMLGEQLGPDDVAAVAGHLPSRLGHALRARPHRPGALEELYEHVSVRARVPFGMAVELAEASCASLAAALDHETRVLLAHRLPDAWAPLAAVPPAAEVPDAPHGTRPGQGHTLATGRPGSHHPLSEERPPGAQPDSVARAANPQADRKLSSGQPDDAEQTLAAGRPGASTPLADARDERQDR